MIIYCMYIYNIHIERERQTDRQTDRQRNRWMQLILYGRVPLPDYVAKLHDVLLSSGGSVCRSTEVLKGQKWICQLTSTSGFMDIYD